ncbi:protein max-like isoform X3 [Harpegnathos saltator]|uniref:protein max-like isoform X3 n=1 Tax=Harpegnathos saltator TaxID=610380 RepID=UPI0009489F44|nr:protein max-like isoform X3 [Harpegnathos saltator]
MSGNDRDIDAKSVNWHSENKYLIIDNNDENVENVENNDTKSRSGRSSNKTQYRSQTEKREHHNYLERKRRDDLKMVFFHLKNNVPTILKGKASRAVILTKTIEYIQKMREETAVHQRITQLVVKELKKELPRSCKSSTYHNKTTIQVSINFVICNQILIILYCINIG